MSSNQIKALKALSSRLSVLYVEDEETLRKNTSELLNELFKEVDVASDGEEGLSLYKKHFAKTNSYYDIVVSDIKMPKLDGIEMSKQILKINKKQKIVIVSAHEEKSYLFKLIAMGIEDFIQKPISLKHMVKVLYKVCNSFELNNLQYFQALQKSSIVSKSDINGIITYVNDKLVEISGYSRDELIGRSHSIFRHPDNPDSLYKELWSTIRAGKVWKGRVINRNKDGSSFIAETTIIPYIDERGEILEYMAIRDDVTDMFNCKCELFSQERERIKKAQESFLIVFTHELKTPLNSIINFTKYVKKQLQKSEDLNRKKLSNLLESVVYNAKDMLENITQILEISKFNAQKLNYKYTLFSAKDLIATSFKKFDLLINEKKIKLCYYTKEDLFIYSDEYRVKQIFSNILSNAIKYGGGEITIILLKDKDKDKVSIVVEDNGPGIKDKDAVFELYAQEDEDLLQRKGQGTGIGLYFIKLLCDDLGIEYKVEDRQGASGTKFTLSFDNQKKRKKKGVKCYENTDC